MARPGHYLYRCEDCGGEQYVHWTERTRAKLLSCQSCGSPWMEPKSRGAKEQIVQEDIIYHEGAKGSVKDKRKG